MFIMLTFQPNLVPPITTVEHALDYKKRLQETEPKVDYLMSLYLHPDITPATIIEAKKAGITGVKSYPAGLFVTQCSTLANK
jgi:dihydroorotase